ncbi:MAG: aminopeptidase N [Gammaproteobacteria bacterium]|nr:aminopeptidase N [Gammaproteobacteria bacterium]
MSKPTPTTTYLKDYTASIYKIVSTKLLFEIDAKQTKVVAEMYIIRDPAQNTTSSKLILNGKNLTLLEVKLNDNKLSATDYAVTANNLQLDINSDSTNLKITTLISPESNTALTGLYKIGDHICSHCEPDGFSHITYFLDRPDISTKFTTTIVADQKLYPVLLSNGNLIAQGKLAQNRHWVTWEDTTQKPAYLFALLAGNFGFLEDFFVTSSKRKIILRVYANKEQLHECKFALQVLKSAMCWDEEAFGREYDLDTYMLVAIDGLNAAAMENKGLNFFSSDYLLASAKTATDIDFSRIASVIAHEYFHNWTGNRVTIRDWFQIGLKEGITTLREQMYVAATFSDVLSRISAAQIIQNKQFAEDAGPMAHPVRLKSYIEVSNFYTFTIYHKSAEIARMLLTLYGKDTFRKIMDLFFTRYDGKAITIEDFLSVVETVTNTDLTQFKLWYDQPGTPILTIEDSYTKENKSYSITIKQTNTVSQAKNLLLPFAIGLLDKNGRDIFAATKILGLSKVVETFTFNNVTDKPIPSLLRNFSAPAIVDYPYQDDELFFLLTHDSDLFNRWHSMQQLLTKNILQLCQDYRQQKTLKLNTIILNAFRSILRNSNLSAGFVAELLQLPVKNYLIEKMPEADFTAVHFVCEFIRNELCRNLKPELLSCYNYHNKLSAYDFNEKAMGVRSLKNLCLNYLMQLSDPKILDICLKQYRFADNLTDIIGALVPLSNYDFPDREKILDEFYLLHKHQPQVIDKWLTINASIKLPNTLQRLQKIIMHPAFNYNFPSKVLRLIRTFYENNLINFHQADGKGYEFLAEQILILDKINPHTAAHIALPLIHSKKLDPTRQKLMQDQVKRILNQPNLSNEVYEVIKHGAPQL